MSVGARGEHTMRAAMRTVAILSLLLLCACSVPNGTNINEREAYWKAEIANSIAPGATHADLERFAQAHGEQLECYQNGDGEDQCDITDHQSAGGTSNLPMRLAVIFKMQDEKYVSHLFATEHVEPQ